MRERRSLPRYSLVLVLPLIGGLIATVALRPQPMLVWNISASAPVGLYAIGNPRQIAAHDMVLARVPARWRWLAATRHYIPINVPLVKRAVGVPGDTVCAIGESVFVNGRHVAQRRATDGQGRPMPWWTGCERLPAGALFLLMDAPDSFDGRYFGPTAPGDIIGQASLIWAR